MREWGIRKINSFVENTFFTRPHSASRRNRVNSLALSLLLLFVVYLFWGSGTAPEGQENHMNNSHKRQKLSQESGPSFEITDTSAELEMYSIKATRKEARDIVRVTFHKGREGTDVLSWQAAIELLRTNKPFRDHLTEILKGCKFTAFFWETPPLTATLQSEIPFEFSLSNAPSLERMTPDPVPFDDYIGSGNGKGTDGVKTFQNLGRDATLVSPCHADKMPMQAYGHFANFIRMAPRSQVDALWIAIGDAVANELPRRGSRPLWVSTSGGGVSWLHVRLDDRPKYYTDDTYRAWTH